MREDTLSLAMKTLNQNEHKLMFGRNDIKESHDAFILTRNTFRCYISFTIIDVLIAAFKHQIK